MFKLISHKAEVPENCYIIAKVYQDGEETDKIVCKYKGIGRNKEYDNVLVEKELKKNPNKCPLCDKVLSSKPSVKRHLNNNSCPVKKIQQYENKENEEVTGFTNEIVLPINKYVKNVYPNLSLRDILYIWGAQGSGKSTQCRNYLNDFMEAFPEKAIILFSYIEHDAKFNDLIDENKIIKMNMDDPAIIDEPIQVKTDLIDSLTIFDDYDNSKDKKIADSLFGTLWDTLTLGRDQTDSGLDTYCVVTSHDFDNRKKKCQIVTKEASTIVMFPKAGQFYYVNSCMKLYCGVDKKTREKIMNLDTRWIAIHKRWPVYCLHEGGCFTF